ncbi:MAG: hypothetical protein EA362_08075 [Saprospirales bacterium]|nr:MAG: hypothetical protein EA362_08075 [Saprospirales bacterium]
MSRIFFIVLIIFTFLLTACVKETDYFIPDGTFEFVGDVQALRQELRPETVFVNFEMPEEETIIPISDRVHLLVDEGTLLDEDGNSFSGEVEVSLRTAAEISEWAGWDFSMITEDGFLDAIASQKIKFHSADHIKLKINPDNPPLIRWLSEEERKEVYLFKRDKGSYKWNFHSTDVVFVEREEITDGVAETTRGYEFTISDEGWYTIGTELLMPHGSDICLKHSEGFTKKNTTSFVTFKNHNTLVILNGWDTANPYKNCNSLLRLPINEDVKVASIAGISGNRYFFDQVSFNLSPSEIEIEMNPKRNSLNQILNRLNN